MRLQGVTPERPMTHDLFSLTLAELGVTLEADRRLDLSEDTFRARLLLQLDGREVDLDARPSDAIALAVRAGVPIFCHRRGARPGGRHSRGRRGREAVSLPRVRQLAQRRPARGAGRGAQVRLVAQDGLAALQSRAAIGPQPQPKQPEVADRAQHDLRIGAGRRAGRARVVRHSRLDHPPAALAELDQQLGRQECAARFEAESASASRRKSLHRAVGVAHPEAVEDAQRETIGARIGESDERIGALEPVADDDIRWSASASRSSSRPMSAMLN